MDMLQLCSGGQSRPPLRALWRSCKKHLLFVVQLVVLVRQLARRDILCGVAVTVLLRRQAGHALEGFEKIEVVVEASAAAVSLME